MGTGEKVGLTMRVDAARERRDALDQAWYILVLSLSYSRSSCRIYPILRSGATRRGGGLAGVILTGGNDLSQFPVRLGPLPNAMHASARCSGRVPNADSGARCVPWRPAPHHLPRWQAESC